MRDNHPAKKKLRARCGQMHEDDLIDPKEYFQRTEGRNKPDRKTLQLCSQVADTLNLVLAGESGDDLLRGLCVMQVAPAPNASQLLVTVSPLFAEDGVSASEVIARLQAASGTLRVAVAQSITRRRTPKLIFQFASATPTQGERS